MYQKGRKKGSVRFRVKPSEQKRRVFLAGEFNGWDPSPMRRQKDGSFAATLELEPGQYQYKFLLDEDWVHDTEVPGVVINCFGTFNSVAVVG